MAVNHELEPDPEPLRPPRPEVDAPAIVVVLGPKVPIGVTDDLARHAEDNLDLLEPLREFLARNDVTRTSRVVTAVGLDDLLAAEEEARNSDFPPLESLGRFWRIDVTGLRGRRTPRQLVDEVLEPERERAPEDRGVARAYVESAAENPGGVIAPLTAASGQGWLREGAEGVNAWAARDHLGGRGDTIGVVDVEQGWQLRHPDVDGLVSAPLVHLNRFDVSPAEGDHGTSVLGLVAGRDNTVGGTGIAARATVDVCSHYDGGEAMRTVDAILVARDHLRAGDVLLLEVHLPHLHYLCAEADDATFHAIRLASAKGILVVEAAGNGSEDLSTWTSPAGRRLDRDVPEQDSGAIVVAAGRHQVEIDAGVSGHRWNQPALSNYGRRVDCYAWGDGVRAPVVDDYGDFGGTSAASAIVAGVVAAVQGMVVAAGRDRLGPRDMRTLLRDTPGTRQVPLASTFLIGIMPDLGALAAAVGAQLATGSSTDTAVPDGLECSA